MASDGHTGTHPPQPLHAVLEMTATSLPSSDSRAMASYGQVCSQAPHQVQVSTSTVATSGSSSAKPRLRMAALWVTAARPEATASDEGRGAWQAPQM